MGSRTVHSYVDNVTVGLFCGTILYVRRSERGLELLVNGAEERDADLGIGRG